MTERPDLADTTRDGDLLADLFDEFLQAILDGRQPDLDRYRRERPDLAERITKTWSLACSVAGRREPSRPVLGGYEIVRELGHGGMGTVYLATHQALQRQVAIKVLPHSLAMSPRAKQRFLEEARALARLRHEHVVHVHRIIDHADMLAFEMEFVDGPNLRTLTQALRQQSKPQALSSLAAVLGLPVEALGTRNVVEWFVRLGIKIARALGEVHRHGLVHRDVKPSNILLRTDGQPVLADFGLAREGDLDATHTSFAGTPVYAAPERLRSGDAELDARADVYSLAVTLHEALTLDPPFGAKTTAEMLRRIEEGSLPPLRQRAPHVSRDLETVIGKAMEVDRRHRYATADEFADDLERLLALQPIHARPAGPLRRAWQFVRRHHKVAMAAAAGAVLVAAVAWPVLAHARARDAATAQAAAQRHAARSRLLCPENLYSSWSPARHGIPQQTLRTAAVRDAQLAELEAALQDYDAAVATTPADDALALERAVVRAVTEVLRAEGRGDEPARVPTLTPLPPLTAALVQRAATGVGRDDSLHALLAQASPADRFAAGLFAFLRNDHATSEECWRTITPAPGEDPFLDACVALQVLGDGGHERAFARLFHAVRAFPRSSALAFAMADAAIATNDLALAENWLGAIPETEGSRVARSQRKRLATDILAARGQYELARQGYAELRAHDSSDPEPLQRLAALAMRTGRTREAEAMLRELLRRWPDLAQPRVQLARLALQRHDLPRYLEQVRHVLAQDLVRLARGTARQLASVLELGGLHAEFAQLCRDIDQFPGALRGDEAMPLTAWLPEPRVAGIAASLRLVQSFDRHHSAESLRLQRPIVATLRAAWRTLLDAPGLGRQVGWPAYAAVCSLLPRHIEPLASWLEPRLLPYQQVLGNRVNIHTLPRLCQTDTPPPPIVYGLQVLRLGDVDGDTLEDVCITAPSLGSFGGGFVEFRGLGDGNLLEQWHGEDDAHAFARAVTPLGDVDGDLCTDLVIGCPLANMATDARATVLLRSGRTGRDLWVVEDDGPSFGAALATLGDVDGDGCDDVAVGAPPLSLDPSARGRVVVLSGRTGQPLYEVTADRGGVWFGAALGSAGDANGDGTADLVVGGNFGRAAGLVCLYDGRSGTLLSSFREEDPSQDFGWLVAGIGDVDADGHADVAIGAPALSSGGREPGQVHVLSGRTGRTLYQLRGDQVGDGFGAVLCPLPWYHRRDRPAIAVATRRGGPIGNGYVRMFSADDGQPVQTSAAGGGAPFALSLADFGDRDGDGFRDLGAIQRSFDHVSLCLLSYAQVPPEQRSR
ncbi:MAG: protein kinase [Planctomycetes bacterium]|nr:protein kinase [Planctomycetota bacterium]